MKAIGQLLKNERLRKGMRLRTLAKAAQVAPGYVSEIEHGLRQPSPEVIVRLAQALELEVDEETREALERARIAARMHAVAARYPQAVELYFATEKGISH